MEVFFLGLGEAVPFCQWNPVYHKVRLIQGSLYPVYQCFSGFSAFVPSDNMLKLSVYFEDLNVETIEETLSYDVSNFTAQATDEANAPPVDSSTTIQSMNSPQTPRKYISIGQRSSPWPYNSVEVEMKFHLECKIHFPSSQLMLRKMHSTNVSESIEAKY